jgi:phage terminase large subunit GpA-like protein
MSVSEWADQFRYLSAEGSAESGRYRTDRTPYMRDIMDALSPSSPWSEIVVIKCAQIGFSEAGNNWIGYVIDRAPGPMMMVQPTIEMAEDYSKQRLAPMFRDSPCLTDKMAPAKSRDASNTIRQKYFPGGMLNIAGANSSASLASKPIKLLFLDEIDRYPDDVDGEGCPIKLAEKRTATFSRRKIFKGSSPTIRGASKIEAAYDLSTKGRFHVPCPHCQHEQTLRWPNLRWGKHPDKTIDFASIHYQCEACAKPILEHHKSSMLPRGRWIHERPKAKAIGFHINALYSPIGWCSWSDLVRQWDEAQGNPVLLKAFVNTNLGESYEISAEDAVEWRTLYDRAEERELGTAPRQCLTLTAGADVQKDRIELYVYGWNRREVWLVDRQIFYGDTAGDAPYLALDEYLSRPVPHELGIDLPIRRLAIDSGYQTMRVYQWVRSKSPAAVMAVDGRDSLAIPVAPPKIIDFKVNGKEQKRGVRLWAVGSSILKAEVSGRLKLTPPTAADRAAGAQFPATFVHFPRMEEEFFKQMTAERQVRVKTRTGQTRFVWQKTYPANEALDCFVYAIAAYHAVGLHKLREDQWSSLEAEIVGSATVAPPPTPKADATQTTAAAKDGERAPPPAPQPRAVPKPVPAPRRRRESTFWNR